MATLVDGLTEASLDTLAATDERAPLAEGLGPGENAGRYRILEKIGAGGMGVVYAAYDPQLDRRIALKLLRPRSEAAGSRAERERHNLMQEAQAMARLAHPNVVAIHDVGTLEGAVFIAMEYVVGKTLREHMKAAPADADPEALIALFCQAGRGLAAAHDAGLVHRDFKPDNVIVGEDGRVRVLDFGIAHEHEHGRSEAPTTPGAGQALVLAARGIDARGHTLNSYAHGGTPAYMSPEQFDNGRPDPRSDQYSFCVALYEALYRRRPFEGETFLQLYTAVSEGQLAEPPVDSPERPQVRAAVLRGLSRDPTARWDSMDALLAALEPPVERPSTSPARWLGLGFALFACAAALGWSLRPREQPCRHAASELAEVWGPGSDARARVEAALSSANASYGAETWARVDARLSHYTEAWIDMHTQACEATKLHQTQSEQLLDLRMACLGQRREELGALVELLAEADADMVEHAVSAVSQLPELERCADLDALTAPIAPPPDAQTEAEVAALRQRLGQLDALRWAGRELDAQPLAEQLMGAAEATGYLPLATEVRLRTGLIDEQLGDYPRARERLERAYADALAVGDEGLATTAARDLVVLVGHRLKRPDEALVWAAVARARSAARAPEGLNMAKTLSYEGLALHARADHQAALERHEQAVQLLRALPNQRGELASALNNMGISLRVLGDYARAESIYREVLAMREDIYGARHPLVGSSLHNISLVLYNRNELDAALELELRASELLRASLGDDAPRVLTSYEQLAIIYDVKGEWEQARPLYERAIAGLRKRLGDSHPDVADAELNLGGGLYMVGDYEGAKQRYEIALAIYRSELGDDHPAVASALGNLAEVDEVREDYDSAIALYTEALALLEAHHGERHPTLPFMLLGLGRSLLAHERAADALAHLERGLELSLAFGDNPLSIADLRFSLAQVLHTLGREAARVRSLGEEALAAYAASPNGGENAELVRQWLSELENAT